MPCPGEQPGQARRTYLPAARSSTFINATSCSSGGAVARIAVNNISQPSRCERIREYSTSGRAEVRLRLHGHHQRRRAGIGPAVAGWRRNLDNPPGSGARRSAPSFCRAGAGGRKQRRAGGKRRRAYAYVPGVATYATCDSTGRRAAATASIPRRTGRGMESEAAALRWAAPPLRCERSSADTG